MFSHSQGIVITGGTFTQYGNQRSVLSMNLSRGFFVWNNLLMFFLGTETLYGASSPNALHDSEARFDPPKCHPDTRKAVLEYLMKWILGEHEQEALIVWLYGPAGSGKSAILQTIAERCSKLDVLLASYFFWKSDGTRNHPKSLIATIAYQISLRVPEIQPAFSSIVAADPMIFDRTLDSQLKHLIIDPLNDLALTGFFEDCTTPPRLVLIDGLDECSRHDHRNHILRAVARALREHHIPLIFLISSRPESDIMATFHSEALTDIWHSLVLDNSFSPAHDIRIFIEASFKSIKETHPMRAHLPYDWPSIGSVNTLVWKSSGQFIYASVVIKFISSDLELPHHQLDAVLGTSAPPTGLGPFAELDAIYMHILSSVRHSQLMMDILALLVDGYDGFEPRLLDLKLPRNIGLFLDVDYAKVHLVLTSLASVLSTTQSRSQLAHASLRDFLLDQSRSERFHIDIGQYNLKCFYRAMDYIRSPPARPNLIRDTSWKDPPVSVSLDSRQQEFQLENKERYQRSDLLYVLSEFMRRIPLTDDIQDELLRLPLEDIWKNSHHDPTDAHRAILHILHRIRSQDYARPRHLYNSYLMVLEPLFRSDMDQYCLSSESALTDALIISLDVPSPYSSQNILVTDPFWTHERCSFAQILFGPKPTIFGGDDYTRAAIRAILTLIPQYRDPCNHFSERHCRIAHNIGYYMGTIIMDRRDRLGEHKHRKGLKAVRDWSRASRSLFTIYIMDSYQARATLPVPDRYIPHTFREARRHDYRLRHASDQYTFSLRKLTMPRRRRVEKHQRGVTHHVYQRYDMLPLHKTVSSLLPILLEKSSHSSELIALIEKNLRYFEFGYTKYHRVRRAFAEYLLRTTIGGEAHTTEAASVPIDDEQIPEDGKYTNRIDTEEVETNILLQDDVKSSADILTCVPDGLRGQYGLLFLPTTVLLVVIAWYIIR